MGAILLTFFTFVLIIISLFLMLVILMQRSSANASMGSAFGAGLTESTFGAEAGNVLTKATIWTTGAFFVVTLGLYLGHMAVAKKKAEESVYSELLQAQAAAAAASSQPAESSNGALPLTVTSSDGTPVTVTIPAAATPDAATESSAAPADSAPAAEPPVESATPPATPEAVVDPVPSTASEPAPAP